VVQLVEALCYKTEGRGFDSRYCHWNFFIFTTALGSTQPLTEMSKGKSVPLHARCSQGDSRKLRFPDYLTAAQDGGNVVSITHGPLLPPVILISVRG